MLFRWPIRGQLFQPEEDRTIDFNLITILSLAFALFVGVVIGITVGRNSSKANQAYDQLRERAERAEKRIRELSSRDKQPEE